MGDDTLRFDKKLGESIPTPDVDEFLRDVMEVCRKHQMSLGHEDDHGAFIVYRDLKDSHIQWLMAAMVGDPED